MSFGHPRYRIVEHLGVGLRQLFGILAEAAGLGAQCRIAKVGEVDLVDLDVAATGGSKVRDLFTENTRDVVVELLMSG